MGGVSGGLSCTRACGTDRDAMVPKPHLTHIALWTQDMDRAIDFYRRFCSLEIVHDRREPNSVRVVWVGETRTRPRFVIVLIEGTFDRSAPNSLAHFGFSCASREDVDRRAAEAREEGVLEMEPRDAGPIVGYYCIVNDPDGNSVEFSFGQTIDPGFFRKTTMRETRRAARVGGRKPPRKRPSHRRP
jgi:catechol 2,3-dioxygenase-like lactoylglutathione lyase family enzyme